MGTARSSIKAFGLHGVIFAVGLLFMWFTFYMILQSFSADFQAYAGNYKTKESAEHALEAFYLKKNMTIVVTLVMALFAILFELRMSSGLDAEVQILKRVLHRSPTTNMVVNTHSFKKPLMRELAESYNAYVRKKMEEYRDGTQMKKRAEAEIARAESMKSFNEKILGEIPLPLYLIVRDGKGFSIIATNKAFQTITGKDLRNRTECDTMIKEEACVSHRGNEEAIKGRTGTEQVETRTYNEVEGDYYVWRTPITDDQDIVICLLVLLMRL